MFDPSNVAGIMSWGEPELAELPAAEDELHEFKSSRTNDKALAEKIALAASAFWNSGGGVFVAGVDGSGRPDGGIAATVGRQSRDWIDQAVARVSPRAAYTVHLIDGPSSTGTNLTAGNSVAMIGFPPSELGPHMAFDNRYHIRAGAHTVAASHFLVDALFARRGSRRPLLRHVVRRSQNALGTLQVGILCLSEAPALDVAITFDTLPELLSPGDRTPFVVPAISRDNPFFFDIELLTMGGAKTKSFMMEVTYRDVLNDNHAETMNVNADTQMGRQFIDTPYRDLERGLDRIEAAVTKLASEVKNKRLK